MIATHTCDETCPNNNIEHIGIELLGALKDALILIPMMAPVSCSEDDRRQLIGRINSLIAKAEGQ